MSSTTPSPSTTVPSETITAKEFNAVKHRLAELTTKIAELQRKSRGTTKANAEVARFEAQVKTLTTQLKLAGDRYNNASDPVIKASAAGKIYALDSRLTELFGDLDGRITTLEETSEQHTGLLAEQGVLLSDHTTGISMLNEGHLSLSQRVSQITTGSTKTPGWKFVISIFAGIIAGLVWSNHTFADSVTLKDGQVVTIQYAAASAPWAAMLIGVAAAGLVLGFLLSFVGTKASRTKTSTTTYDHDEVPVTPPAQVVRQSVKTRTTTVPPQEPVNPTPTAVLPRTESGVPVDARS